MQRCEAAAGCRIQGERHEVPVSGIIVPKGGNRKFCHPQMVWESGCAVIVMLTPLSENGVRQCHHYWPEEGSNLYHVYEVPGRGAHSGVWARARISSPHQQPAALWG